MQNIRVTLTPLSAFATSLKGDTLFGQLCWAIRNRLGEERLNQCLEGYTNNQPFAVVSDAFPEGYLPLPKLPSCFYQLPEGEDRKAIKKRAWLPEAELQKPLNEWLCHAVNAKAIACVGAMPTSRLNTFLTSAKNTRNHTTPSIARPTPPAKAGLRLTALNRNGLFPVCAGRYISCWIPID